MAEKVKKAGKKVNTLKGEELDKRIAEYSKHTGSKYYKHLLERKAEVK